MRDPLPVLGDASFRCSFWAADPAHSWQWHPRDLCLCKIVKCGLPSTVLVTQLIPVENDSVTKQQNGTEPELASVVNGVKTVLEMSHRR